MQEGKVFSEEDLQIAEKRREEKGKAKESMEPISLTLQKNIKFEKRHT